MKTTEINLVDGGLDGDVMPSQYDDLVRRRFSIVKSEYLLLWAVLEDAIRAYQANKSRSTSKKRKAFEELRRWFESRDTRQGLFAFPTICEFLAIDPDGVLKRLDATDSKRIPRRHRRIAGKPPNHSLAA